MLIGDDSASERDVSCGFPPLILNPGTRCCGHRRMAIGAVEGKFCSECCIYEKK